MPIQLTSSWSKDASKDSTHVYLDINAVNNDTFHGRPIPLAFSQNRNEQYLKEPEDYYASIIRFSIDTHNNIPNFIPQVMPDFLQRRLFPPMPPNPFIFNPNITLYAVSLQYEPVRIPPGTQMAVSGPVFLTYVPTNLFPAIPETYLPDSLYYYCHSLQILVRMINEALQLAMTKLIANALLLSPPVVLDYAVPFIQFDSSTSLFTMYTPKMNTTAELFNIYMNTTLQPLLCTFSSYHVNNNSESGQDYLFNFQSNQVINNGLALTGYNFLSQDEPSIASINPVNSIVFCTNLIPVDQSYVSPVTPFNLRTGDQALYSIGTNSNIVNSLTDFQVQYGHNNTYATTVFYAPISEYRLFDMNASSSLSIIDFNVYWKDRYGNLYPIYVFPTSHVNIKIMFRKKDFNKKQ
jgi:hypothetical protein